MFYNGKADFSLEFTKPQKSIALNQCYWDEEWSISVQSFSHMGNKLGKLIKKLREKITQFAVNSKVGEVLGSQTFWSNLVVHMSSWNEYTGKAG